VLFLTCHLPYPPFSGGRLREFELLKRVGDSVDLHLVSVSKTPAEDRAHASSLAGSFLDAAQVVVAPLRVGGGIKVKMIEALARGRPIVATSIAAQGLGSGSRHMRIADDPTSFAGAVVGLLCRPEERLELALAARAFARTLPSWDDAAVRLMACHRELLPVSSSRSASVA
jgi:glycosyltransferase involved in cell wall biosynthesis